MKTAERSHILGEKPILDGFKIFKKYITSSAKVVRQYGFLSGKEDDFQCKNHSIK